MFNFFIKLKKTTINNFELFLNNNPFEIDKCISRISPRKINSTALAIYEASSNDEINNHFLESFTKKGKHILTQILISLYNGNKFFEYETEAKTLKGNVKSLKIYSRLNENSNIALVYIIDITKRVKTYKKLEKRKKQIRKFAEHLETIREEERTRIAREIHDNLGQLLTAIRFDIDWINSHLKENNESVSNKIKTIKKLIDNSINTVQRISTELRPGIIENLGLIDAIEWHINEFSERTNISHELFLPSNNLKLNERLSVNLFRIVQEALTNISRHAKAKSVYISVVLNNGFLKLLIKDDGIGINQSQIDNHNSFGLIGINERVVSFNGSIKITGEKNKGTQILIKIPLNNKS